MKLSVSLRTRLVGLFLALGLIPLGIFALVSMKHSASALTATSGDAMESVATQTMVAIETQLNERYSDVQAFASTTKLEPERLHVLPGRLNTFVSLYSQYDLMLVLDAGGTVIAVNTKDHAGNDLPGAGALLGRDLSGEPYFTACMSGGIGRGQSYHEEVNRYPLVAEVLGGNPMSLVYASPIHSVEGTLNGAWVTFASWERTAVATMNTLRRDYKEDGKVSFECNLLRADGLLIDDKDPARILSVNLREAGLGAAIALGGGKDGYIVENHQKTGIPQINGYAVSHGIDGRKLYDWGILARLNVAEANAQIAAMRRWSLMLILGFGAGLGVIAWMVGNNIASPVRKTAHLLDRVAQGQLDETLTLNRADELGQMANSLNRTIEVLREADALRKASEGQQQEMLRVKAMVENSTLAMLYVDTENRIQYTNPAATHLLKRCGGISPESLDHAPLARALPMGGELQKRGSDSASLPWTGTLPLGEFQLSFTIDEIRDTRNERQGVCISFEDITERLANEELVRRAAERERLEAAELQSKVDQLLTTVSAAAAGDLRQEIPITGTDAIGQVGTALNGFFHALRSNITTIGTNLGQLQDSSSLLGRISAEMSSSAEATSTKAGEVANTTTQISGNMQTSASGAEEMGASIREISRNTAEAAQVAAAAVQLARTTGTAMSQLNTSSVEIGEVVKVISSIAEQTNLLALNATIEAARAGDAGKGFAVVANEVKELAKESAKATENIGQKIATIQENTGRAVGAIEQITTIINKINDLQNAIASAVEEQSVTTGEISRSVHEAAAGSNAIVARMADLGVVAEASTRGAVSTADAVEHLNRIADDLGGLMQRFRV